MFTNLSEHFEFRHCALHFHIYFFLLFRIREIKYLVTCGKWLECGRSWVRDPKTIKLAFVASPLSTCTALRSRQPYAEKKNPGFYYSGQCPGSSMS
jgi:hypothetical protein